jgi:hypothetical protein
VTEDDYRRECQTLRHLIDAVRSVSYGPPGLDAIHHLEYCLRDFLQASASDAIPVALIEVANILLSANVVAPDQPLNQDALRLVIVEIGRIQTRLFHVGKENFPRTYLDAFGTEPAG